MFKRCALLLALLAVPAAVGQTAGPCTPATTDNDVCDKAEKGINSLIAAATRIAGPIMSLTFIASAIAYGTSNENAKAVGKRGMLGAGIGLAVIILANGIMLLIRGSFA